MDTEDYIWYLDDQNMLNSSGYRINNMFKKLDIPPIKGNTHPLNCDTTNDIAIPAGLVYIHALANPTESIQTEIGTEMITNDAPVSEDLYSKLLSLVQVEKKPGLSKTRKRRKSKKNKSRKKK